MLDLNLNHPHDNQFISTNSQWIFGDIEPTYPEGQEKKRHIIECHFEDEFGQTLFSSAINPGINLGCKFARKGLPSSYLQLCPRIEDVEDIINCIIRDKNVVLWGAEGDRAGFPNRLEAAGKVHCAMQRFAPLAGDYSHYHGDYKWASLERALEILAIPKPPGIAHRAATDTRALRLVWEWMERNSIAALLQEAARNRPDPFP